MLATPPFWASSKKALLRANNKPPVELVVDDLENHLHFPGSRCIIRFVVQQTGACRTG